MKAQVVTLVKLIKLKQSQFVRRNFFKGLVQYNGVVDVNEYQLNHHEI